MQGVGRFSGSTFLVMRSHQGRPVSSGALPGGCRVQALGFSRMGQLTWTDPLFSFFFQASLKEAYLWQALRHTACFPTILARKLFLMLNLNPSRCNSRPLPLVECKWGTAAPAQALTSAISQDDPARQARVIRSSLALSAHVSIPACMAGDGLAGPPSGCQFLGRVS